MPLDTNSLKNSHYKKIVVATLLLSASSLLLCTLVRRDTLPFDLLLNVSGGLLLTAFAVWFIEHYSGTKLENTLESSSRKAALRRIRSDQVLLLQVVLRNTPAIKKEYLSNYRRRNLDKQTNILSIQIEVNDEIVPALLELSPQEILSGVSINYLLSTLRGIIVSVVDETSKTISRYSFAISDHESKLALANLEESLINLSRSFDILEMSNTYEDIWKGDMTKEEIIRQTLSWPISEYLRRYSELILK